MFYWTQVQLFVYYVCQPQQSLFTKFQRDQDISLSGQKFELPEKVDLLSAQSFVRQFLLVYIKANELQ